MSFQLVPVPMWGNLFLVSIFKLQRSNISSNPLCTVRVGSGQAGSSKHGVVPLHFAQEELWMTKDLIKYFDVHMNFDRAEKAVTLTMHRCHGLKCSPRRPQCD